ncbi:MAG: hypothetical protein J0I41_21885 [Filimonas sp.]|nr:hypothetical protein [Filimonas sp.]
MKGVVLSNLITVLFALAFIGYQVFYAQEALYPVWYVCCLAGVILFIWRIVRGDD